MNYDQQKATALNLLGALQANAHQLRDLLNNAKQIRHDGCGTPEWLHALRSAQESLGRALAGASRNASVT